MKYIVALILLSGFIFAEEGVISFNGDWEIDVGLTERIGFGSDAWKMEGNQALIGMIKTMKLKITDDIIISEMDGKTLPPGLGEVVKRTVKQIVLMKRETTKISLLTLLSENSLMMESGHPFRFVFRRIH